MQPPENSFEGAGSSHDQDSFTARTEQFAREEPLKAVGAAFVGGLILTLLPVGALVGGVLRLSLSLLRPALLILGAVKLYEEIEKRQHE